MEVEVVAVGSPVELLGWRSKRVNFNGRTVEDLLRSVGTEAGKTLYEVLVEGGEIKQGYAVALNGLGIGSKQGLKTEIEGSSTVAVLQFFPVPSGG